MQLRKTVANLNGIHRIDVMEEVVFNKVDRRSFLDTFQSIKDIELLKAGSFDDIIWFFPCDVYLRDFKLLFDIELYREINLALKGYVLVRRISGTSAAVLYKHHNILKKAVLVTEGFNNLSELKNYFITTTKEKAWDDARIIKTFLEFYKPPFYNELIEICSNVPKQKHGNRELPDFQDVLLFDQIVEHFFSNSGSEQSMPYLPISIWWKLTNVLPLRPYDFFILKNDCLEVKTDNSFWLKLSRSKKRVYSPEMKSIIPDTIQIDIEMYNLISNYKLQLERLGIESEYLFPYEYYSYFLKSKNKVANNVRIANHQFAKLLRRFYENIVKGQYSEEVDKITAGDTRHFAIINMFLQGFNPLSIARMAGHERLEQQRDYFSHAAHFAQSYVYHMAQQRLLERKISKPFSPGIIGWRREVVDKGRITTITNQRKVDYGYCNDLDHDFPINCVDDCRVCPYYIFKPTIDEYEVGIQWLQDYSNVLDQKIAETIDIMKHISKTLYAEIRRTAPDSTLKSLGSQLGTFMENKSIIDAKLMELKMYEEENKQS